MEKMKKLLILSLILLALFGLAGTLPPPHKPGCTTASAEKGE
jgi:hypothetical protein